MPSFFVPARSAQHRRACTNAPSHQLDAKVPTWYIHVPIANHDSHPGFALYRSLLRLGPRVPLPDALTTSSPLGPAHPIPTLIRNAFRRNKRDLSPRLVISALKAGYRFLTLLSHATDPTTPEHASTLNFLHANQSRVLALKAKTAAEQASRVSTAPNPDRIPLLTRVSPPGEPPVYEPTGPPRPLESFKSGVRKPPTLAATSGVAFLRFGKPQPRFLERVVRQKSLRRADRITKMMELGEEGMEDARAEDEWERLVGELLAREGQRDKEGGQQQEREVTYRKSLKEAIGYLHDVTERERVDLVARGRAMWKIVLAERELALKEEKERLVREGRPDEEPQLRVWRRPIHSRGPKPRSGGGKGRAKEGTESVSEGIKYGGPQPDPRDLDIIDETAPQ